MHYNLVKTNIPLLVKPQLIMKIAKINNKNFRTGEMLPELLKPPSEFQLLLNDIKNTTLKFIRENWLLLLLLLSIILSLYYRYIEVKKIKKQKQEYNQEYNHILTRSAARSSNA